jgi:hypothetical protein
MRKIDILLFIRFSSFPINKMLYIYSTIQNTKKYKTKELALKGITIILSLKSLRDFLLVVRVNYTIKGKIFRRLMVCNNSTLK